MLLNTPRITHPAKGISLNFSANIYFEILLYCQTFQVFQPILFCPYVSFIKYKYNRITRSKWMSELLNRRVEVPLRNRSNEEALSRLLRYRAETFIRNSHGRLDTFDRRAAASGLGINAMHKHRDEEQGRNDGPTRATHGELQYSWIRCTINAGPPVLRCTNKDRDRNLRHQETVRFVPPHRYLPFIISHEIYPVNRSNARRSSR